MKTHPLLASNEKKKKYSPRKRRLQCSYHNLPPDQPHQCSTYTHDLYLCSVKLCQEMLFSPLSTQSMGWVCTTTAHSAVGPLHPYGKRLDFLCSKAMKEGWGQEKEDRNSLKIPGLPSIQKPFIPPSLQGSAGPPEMRPQLWVPGLCPSGWLGLLGLSIQIAIS